MQDIPFDGKRLGIHYFPDSDHYGKSDIERWLPILKSLGVQWLSLKSPSERAIPEEFLAELQMAGIQPLIHMPLSLETAPSVDEIAPILAAYAQRGVRYISFFDRPKFFTKCQDVPVPGLILVTSSPSEALSLDLSSSQHS